LFEVIGSVSPARTGRKIEDVRKKLRILFVGLFWGGGGFSRKGGGGGGFFPCVFGGGGGGLGGGGGGGFWGVLFWGGGGFSGGGGVFFFFSRPPSSPFSFSKEAAVTCPFPSLRRWNVKVCALSACPSFPPFPLSGSRDRARSALVFFPPMSIEGEAPARLSLSSFFYPGSSCLEGVQSLLPPDAGFWKKEARRTSFSNSLFFSP